MLMVSPAVADKLDDIKARGKLVIGVAEASPPFSFRDGERGVVGYDVDLSAAVANRLGVGLAKTTIINAERISSLRDGKVDIVAMGMTRTPTRAKDIDFSVATLVSPHKILVRRDSGITKVTDLAGFGLKKDEPRFTGFVNRTLLDLEASGEAAKVFDTWFAPLKRPFIIKPD